MRERKIRFIVQRYRSGAGCQCWPRRGEVTFLKRSERTLNSASIFNITNSYISKCRRFNRIYPLRMFNRRYGSKSRPRPATCVPAKGWHDFIFYHSFIILKVGALCCHCLGSNREQRDHETKNSSLTEQPTTAYRCQQWIVARIV